MRYAIVTAYYQEDRATLERCLESVRRQSVEIQHIVLADGHPQAWVNDAPGVRHIVLDRCHADFGDTPKLLGLLLAMRDGCDAIQFLDADNLIFEGHAELGLALLRETAAHLIVLKRTFLRQDGTDLNWVSPRDDSLRHIDMNCYLFARPSFPTALKWVLIPRQFSFMSDRVFRSVFSKAGHPVAVAPRATVGYTSMWANTYISVGETPPPGTRDHTEVAARAKAWWASLDDKRRALIEATLGVKISIGD